jgi:transitional endoplasmic reticulum ATPase
VTDAWLSEAMQSTWRGKLGGAGLRPCWIGTILPKVLVRDYRADDLAQVVQVWERTTVADGAAEGLAVGQAVRLLGDERVIALVAESDGALVGAVLAALSPATAWIYRLSVAAGRSDGQAIVERLLDALEARVAQAGIPTLAALTAEVEPLGGYLQQRGYRGLGDRHYFELELQPATAPTGVLAELGGQLIGTGLWDALKGMEEAKEIIERRVILPLAEPELADRHGVVPPRAIVLFGPPGTGKTTFAKGIASRLGWPFVEVLPAELAGEGAERQAMLLADAFERILELGSAVVFVDEVEDLAATRHEERRVTPSITNEFLKQVPRLRDAPEHLLVCATNWVARLDPAFLRPGRFDYVLPVGPPDAGARRPIWRRYIEEITDEPIDVEALVQASELFTPADIEFAARKAAQRAFEREHFEGSRQRARTEDFLAAIAATKPTLTAEMVSSFDEDTDRFARF